MSACRLSWGYDMPVMDEVKKVKRETWVMLARHVIDRGILLIILAITASNFDATELRTWGLMILFGGGADGFLHKFMGKK